MRTEIVKLVYSRTRFVRLSMDFISESVLQVITTSRRFKCVIQKWAIPLDFVARRLVLFLWAFTSGATESVLNKFGFIRFGKGEIFWMKTQKRLERNGTIV